MARGTARDKRLADALQECRRLRNQLHDRSQAQLPLRAEIQQLQNEAAVREAKLARAERTAESCRTALLALMEAMSSIAAYGDPITLPVQPSSSSAAAEFYKIDTGKIG